MTTISEDGRVQRTPQNYRCGASHHRAKHSDALVEEARRMRSEGASYGAVARALGLSLWTVRDWCDYRTR